MNFLQKILMKPFWFLWNLMNFSWTSYELLKNFSQTFKKHIAIFLWTSYELPINFLQITCYFLLNSWERITNFSKYLASFLSASYLLILCFLQKLTNFFWTSLKLRTNVLQTFKETSYKIKSYKLLRMSHKSLTNVLQTFHK